MIQGHQNADRVIAVGCTVAARAGAMYLESTDPDAIAEWLDVNVDNRRTRVAIVVDDAFAVANPEAVEAIKVAGADNAHRARIRQNTTRLKPREQAKHFIRNLTSAGKVLHVTGSGACAIVGAGPSLDDALDDLREVGCPVIAVNTALPALRAAGIEPFLSLCVEAIDVSGAFAGSTVASLIDLTAHPANWRAAHRPYAICMDEPNLVPYALAAGVHPLSHGGSATTCAISLALRAGFSEIFLVGQDHAYPTERMYAEHSAFGDLRLDAVDGKVVTTGTSKKVAPQNAYPVQAWGGGEVLSTDVFAIYIDWITRVAKRTRIVNTSHLGACIPGTHEEPASVLRRVVGESLAMERPCESDSARRMLSAELLEAEVHALRGDPTAATIACPLLNMWAVPHMLERVTRARYDDTRADTCAMLRDAVAVCRGLL